MEAESLISSTIHHALEYNPLELIINMSLALILGMVFATAYRMTHKGRYCSQSFVLTIVFSCVIFSFVMVVIGSSLTRAFALAGALSVIRFQTVVKDTKDTAYVFGALVIGMASGVGLHALAIVATIFISTMAFVLHRLNFGISNSCEYSICLKLDSHQKNEELLSLIRKYASYTNLSHLQPLNDGECISLEYDMNLKHDKAPEELIKALKKLEGISDVRFRTAQHHS